MYIDTTCTVKDLKKKLKYMFHSFTKFHRDDQGAIKMPVIARWQLRLSRMAVLSQRPASMFTSKFKVTQTYFIKQYIFTKRHVVASQKTHPERESPNLVPSINVSCNSKQDIPSAKDGNTSPSLSSLIHHA